MTVFQTQSVAGEELIDQYRHEHLQKRKLRELEQTEHWLCQGRGGIAFENIEFIPRALAWVLNLLKLRSRGENNAESIILKEQDWQFANLPESFDGYSILHLSDLHIDGMQNLHCRINDILCQQTPDLTVITGDFRFSTAGSIHLVLEFMQKIADKLPGVDGTLAVLGNHDTAELVKPLEDMGIRVLLNENHQINRGDDTIVLSGLDDVHFYDLGDIELCNSQISSRNFEAFKVLLVHSPEIIVQAERLGYSFYLCGHTHAGQICLPAGIPVITNANCSRRFAYGLWRFNNLQGYTHFGTGASGLPVRFNCKPEIVLHRLHYRKFKKLE